MRVGIASDHRGYKVKEKLKKSKIYIASFYSIS